MAERRETGSPDPIRRPLSIGVVGGSIGGLFTAALLTRDGHRVTVLERSRKGLERRGAGLVAQQELFDLLHEVGRDEAARVGVVAHERITLDRSGRVASSDPSPQTQLSWDHVYETFRALVPADRYLLDHAVAAVEHPASTGAASVALHDGRRLDFDLVVGADGSGSVARVAVVPGATANRYVGYSTWRGLISESALPADAARTLLGRFAFYTAPGEHMLGYLVPGASGEVGPGHRRYNWVWYRPLTPDALRTVMVASGRPPSSVSLAPGELEDDLRRGLAEAATRRLPPPFAAAVLAEPEPFLQAIVDFVPPRIVRGRVALLGDAAVTVRPHTAMGAAKAAGDALALAHALSRGGPVEAALERYQAQRLPVGAAIAEYGQRLGRSIPLVAA